MSRSDPRRSIPRTDVLLGSPPLAEAVSRLGRRGVHAAVVDAQERARRGEIAPEEVAAAALAALPARTSSMTPVLNATGVVVHTNLGRAPLSPAAVAAVLDAAGPVDVELDLATGRRGRRGAGARAALLEAVPAAGDALVVNNGAAALVLATTALSAGREVVVSRGELVEIGDGFRLPDLIASTGARLREVGTTNRTHLRDYAEALGPQTGCVLKVHPSNFRLDGFVSSVGAGDLAGLCRPDGSAVPVVADIGSGLLAPDPLLPDEPDAATTLAAGADVVTASGDKLLGGPQAGLVLGGAAVVERLRRHPLARALRVDKLTLAALEASVRGPSTPVHEALHADPDVLRRRAEALAAATGLRAVPADGRVGGGGAPGVPLPGWAVEVPEAVVARLRRPGGAGADGSAAGELAGLPAGSTADLPVVLARVEGGRGLVDVRCIPPERDADLLRALRAALGVDAG